MTELVFNSQQERALEKLVAWWNERNSDRQIFSLYGYAGTGKTTVMKEALKRLEGCEATLTAPTGKAAKVLANKSGQKATTLHRALFKPSNGLQTRLQDRLTGNWNTLKSGDYITAGIPEEEIRRNIEELEKQLKEFKGKDSHFSLNQKGTEGNLLLIDEVSMVPQFMESDIEKVSRKILLVGDPFQLPPVKSLPAWNGREPEVMLTDVVRQSGDGAGISLAAEAIRMGRQPRKGMGFDMVPRGLLTYEDYMEFDVVLCGSNKTKALMDQGIRKRKGYQPGMPLVGEKVMCLNNSPDYHVYNGEVFTITKIVEVDKRHHCIVLNLIDELENVYLEMPCDIRLFSNHQDTHVVPKDHLQFCFTYGSTVHKYQGSEAANICLVDDWLRGEHARWLYTGITRAVDSCTLVS